MSLTNNVDYSTAKLLKEKSFNEPCYSYFTWMTKEVIQGSAYEDNRNSKFEAIKESDVTLLVSAPTIAEIVMWLYETHGIWIEVYFDNSRKEFYTVFNGEEYKFNSPTEAYLQAINYCLTKLI